MGERLRSALPALTGLVLFLAALAVLRSQLHAVTWHELSADLVGTPLPRLGAAAMLTLLNYGVMTGY